MRLFDLQFAKNVLRRFAARGCGSLCSGSLLQCEEIVRLGADDDAFILDRADRIRYGTAAVDAPAIERDVDQWEALRAESRHAVAARELINLLRRCARRKSEDDFVADETLLASRRHSAAVISATATRITASRNGATSPTGAGGGWVSTGAAAKTDGR